MRIKKKHEENLNNKSQALFLNAPSYKQPSIFFFLMFPVAGLVFSFIFFLLGVKAVKKKQKKNALKNSLSFILF